MSFFGKNIKKIRGVKNLSQQAFADIFDLKRGTLGAYEEGRSEPKIDTIIKVANHFSIEIGALLTRELTVNELLKFKTDIATLANDIIHERFTEIPCITEANSTDYLMYYDKENFLAEMPTLVLPVESTSKLRGFVVNNLEMTSNDKGFYPKDVVVGQDYAIDKISDLINGTLVLVVTSDRLILRRLYHEADTIVLKADHNNIDDITIDKTAVKEIWKIKYAFFKRLPDVNDELEQRLLILSSELQKIKDKMV